MRAAMDDGMNTLSCSEPQIERDVAVPGRQQRTMIFRLARHDVAAIRLNRDDQISRPDDPEVERPIPNGLVLTGFTPRRADLNDEWGRQRGERPLIGGNVQDRSRLASR